jgi:hypothetical protein
VRHCGKIVPTTTSSISGQSRGAAGNRVGNASMLSPPSSARWTNSSRAHGRIRIPSMWARCRVEGDEAHDPSPDSEVMSRSTSIYPWSRKPKVSMIWRSIFARR